MVQDQTNNAGNIPLHSEESGNIQNGSESFRTVPKASESFGKVRNDSARFGNIPKPSERKENHSLTVREAARLFEAAGVARTERSIVNWCQQNRQGVTRLDCYFDPNERKYYITPQSVELAISEEKAKADKIPVSEPVGNVRKDEERADVGGEVGELENQIRDLEITNRAKDYYIGRLEKERDGVFEQLLTASRKVGELETKLLQIEGPMSDALKGAEHH